MYEMVFVVAATALFTTAATAAATTTTTTTVVFCVWRMGNLWLQKRPQQYSFKKRHLKELTKIWSPTKKCQWHPMPHRIVNIRCEGEIKWTMHYINLYIDMPTTQLAHCSLIVYTDLSSILLCTTHAETLDQGFINCVKTNCLEISVLANMNLHLPLSNAISITLCRHSTGRKKKKVLPRHFS